MPGPVNLGKDFIVKRAPRMDASDAGDHSAIVRYSEAALDLQQGLDKNRAARTRSRVLNKSRSAGRLRAGKRDDGDGDLFPRQALRLKEP